MYGTKLPGAYTKGLWRLTADGTDSSGAGNTLTDTASDITFTTVGRFGTCATKPDNTRTSVLNASVDVLGSGMQYCTIGFWANITGYASWSVGYPFGLVSKATKRSYYFSVTATQLQLGCFDKTGAGEHDGHYHASGIDVSYTRNAWNFYLYTIDNYVGSIYLNAKKVFSFDYTTPNGTVAFAVDSFSICGSNTRGTASPEYGPIVGSFSEFFIDNRVWTQSEIQKYYTQSQGRLAPYLS